MCHSAEMHYERLTVRVAQHEVEFRDTRQVVLQEAEL
jgi:hypothetical protein